MPFFSTPFYFTPNVLEKAISILDQIMPNYHFERALFVVLEQDSGKSRQLRSMFRDLRMGNNGIIPPPSNLKKIYRLTNERCLFLRISSPHEAKESINQNALVNFLDETEDKIKK